MLSSTMASAPKGWESLNRADMPMPNGLFGRKTIVTCGGVTINGDELDVEFTVPFDDTYEPNEAKVIIYNLTKNTISQFRYNEVLTITAGYGDDTGLIFSGHVSSCITDRDGNDKRTTITAIDDVNLDNREIVSIAYKAGTQASYILKDLVNKLGMPVVKFKITKDETYEYPMNVEGSLSDNIHKFADMCGTSVYIQDGNVYVRDTKDSDSGLFRVSADTGMIESPEAFEEEQTVDGYQRNTITGYKIKMLLQHRMKPASLIKLDSIIAKGQFRVRGGQHISNGSDFITEVEAL